MTDEIDTPVNGERWEPITSAPGYEVSDLGQVRGVARVLVMKNGVRRAVPYRVLQPSIDDYGYPMVNLSARTCRVHVLVLQAFIGPRPQGMQGCHNNGNPADNRVTNLRWDTSHENCLDVVRHGRRPETLRTRCPRGHELAGANLEPDQLRRNKRSCRSCARARTRIHYCRSRGIELDFAATADSFYAYFTTESAA